MSTRTANNRTSPRARGLTFLEIVVSIATLSMVAAVVVGTISFFKNANMLERHTLNATEVANRVILTKLDDPTWRPGAMYRNYEINGFRYAFNMEVDLFELRDGEVKLTSLRDAGFDARITSMEQITVTVALAEPGSTLSGVPLATLVRVRDPRKMDTERVLAWINELLDPTSGDDEVDDEPDGGR